MPSAKFFHYSVGFMRGLRLVGIRVEITRRQKVQFFAILLIDGLGDLDFMRAGINF
jgi:hypothetical protein